MRILKLNMKQIQLHTDIHTHTHTDEWLQLDGETKHVRTEESWGAPTALRVCACVCVRVYVFHLHLAGFFFLPSLWRPVRLNTRSFAPVAEWQLWLGEQRNQVPNEDAAWLHHNHFAGGKKRISNEAAAGTKRLQHFGQKTQQIH